MARPGFMQRMAEKGLWHLIERRSNLSQVSTEKRSSLENPQTPLSFPAEWLLDIFNGGRTDSGIRVSEMTALQTDAVLACVNVIRNGVATLPLQVLEREIKNNRLAHRIAFDNDLYDVLRLQPNPEMTSHTFRSVLEVHGLLWGNGYGEIQRDNAGRCVAIWPRNPARTRPVRLTHEARIEGTLYPRGTLVYHTSETMGDEISFQDDQQNRMAAERIILAEDMIHIPGLSLDGRLGQSTVYLARQIIGLALAAEKYGAKFFGNGAVPQGVLMLPGVLEPKAIENLRRSWQEAHGGENSHKTAVLEQGVKYEKIGVDPEQSQLLSTRKYQRVAMASIFNVPPHMIGEGEASKSTVEQTSIEFLTYCLNPRLDAWEQELKRKLFPSEKPKTAKIYVKFDTHRLLYPDSDSRAKYYTSGKSAGWLNTNDIHELEGMNPVEDGSGDVYWMPVNMQDAANPLTAPHIGGKQNIDAGIKAENPMGGAPQNPEKPDVVRTSLVTRYSRIYYPMFKDATGRVQNRKEVDETVFNRCFTPALYAMVEALSSEFASNPDTAIPATEFHSTITSYMEGMRLNLLGVAPDLNPTYAMKEVRRAAETFATIVANRYNPKHADQPRHTDGKFHDGKKPFFIGRHGTTEDDVAGRWSGWGDVTVNEQGEREIDETIAKLKDQGIKRIVSSDLPRAKYTAQRLSVGLGGIPMTTDWRLNALNLGVFAGLDERTNAARLKIYIDNPDIPIPDGESVNGYIQRSQEAIAEHKAENEATGPILDLAHSSTIATHLSALKGGTVILDNASAMLSPAGVVRLDGKKITVVSGSLSSGDAA
jgi:HK97 family phage portal protein